MNNQLTARIFSFFVIFSMLLSVVGMPTISAQAATTITFTGEELLGKPEDTSITVNIVPDTTIEYHYQYGTTSGSYTAQTSNYTATAGQPHEITISGLNPNTQYFYRMQYHAPGDAMDDWVIRTEHSFWTQRAQGSSFTFSVTSDSHAQFNTAHQQAMTNIYNEHPDFEIDLGDTFYTDNATSQSAVNTEYLAYRNSLYLGKIGSSVPIFLASGNHENEEGWNFDDTPFSIALGSVQARKLYYPTPIQDGFYSGNTDILPAINAMTYGDQYREDYYSWTWGDALFVVIDEFQYTMNLPYTPTAGEGNDDTKTGDQWSWTLGAQQFQWFKQTLENSNAKYKFVFSHQMTGGIPRGPIAGAEAGYVRGGAEAAAYFEWGGNNADGTAGFATHRNPADFGTVPIHQLMVANGVSAYFHGHDHQYVYETRDGIVYQEVPSPSMSGSGFGGIYTAGDHGTYNTIKMLNNSGHLLVTINPTQATVDYVSSTSTTPTVNYSYTILPNVNVPMHVLTTSVSPSGGGTISPSAGDHNYSEGAVVSITATANTGYTFSSWSGACTGSGVCSVTMSGDMSVTANFSAVTTYTLTTSVNNAAYGTINPSAGAHTYNSGDVVTVTATANTGYTFSSWSGGTCSGSGTCSVIMNGNKTVTANFTAVTTYVLTTAVSPSAGGTISPAAGTHTYNSGDVVSVTATPNSGYTFSNWSGACSGSGACSVTMNAAKSVTATFSVAADPITFTGTELLGRPETDRISISAVPDSAAMIRYAYSTTSGGPYTNSSSVSATAGQPAIVTITGLTANTKYYYRMEYSTDGGSTWTARTEKSFWTQRATGSTFTFDITSDNHVNIMLGNSSNWMSTLNEIAADAPDFQIDLGDTFAMDNGTTSVTLGDTASAEQKYKDQLPYFNIVSGSTPIFLTPGNHEQQEAWHLQGTLANSLPVMGTNAQKKFFLNPVPDSFYTGDTTTYSYLSGDQLKQDYYAWTWGDALFVVICPYWTTTIKPYTTTVGGGETDATGSGNRWDWTLGLDQFNWLKTTLQNSTAKYKFVFSHQIVGGNGMTSPNQVNYGHGGVDSANFVEWGGFNTDGTTYTWDTNRPGWGSQPIRQMMEANGVTAFFHGHDHQMAYEKLNSIVYQAVPSGSFTGSFGNYTTGGNSGNTIWADSTQGPGYLRVTVGPSQTTVDFIRYNSTTVVNTYTMAPNATTNYTLTAGNDGHGTVTLNPTGGTYASGTTVTLTPVPSSGYLFSSWSGANGANIINTSGVYTIVMNGNKTVQANFTLSNVAPVASADDYTTHQDLAMTIDAPGVLSNDTDANNDTLTASWVSGPSNGVLTFNANGSFTYTPVSGYKGDDSFTYRANDGSLYSSAATVTIHVTDATPPIVPSSFYGYIYISINPPVAGDLVQAYVIGAANPVATTAIMNTSPLSYAFDVPGDISGTSMVEGGTEGGVITFKINGRLVGTSIWHSGTSVQLDFSVVTHSIALVTGWNLVSFSIHPTSTDIANVLTTVAGNYSLVYAWNATTGLWMKYDPNVGYGNTLANLDESMGFWIKMTTADTLDVSGTAPITSNLALKTGWNLVGYPSAANLALPDVFSLHGVSTDFTLVYAYHASDTSDVWKKYDRTGPAYSNDLSVLAPDYGYWIKVGGNHTWDVSY